MAHDGAQLGGNLKHVGLFLAEHRGQVKPLAFGDCGYVPYYSGIDTLDPNGLHTRAIARRRLSLRQAVAGVDLLLRYRSATPGKAPYARLRVEALGFTRLGSLKVVDDGRSRLWLDFFGRERLFTQGDLDRIPLRRTAEPSWFQTLYYRGRDIVRASR